MSIASLTDLEMAGIISNMKDLKGFLKDPQVKFVAVFASVFLFTFLFLFALGLVPSELREGSSALDNLEMKTLEGVSNTFEAPAPVVEVKPEPVIGEAPLRVSIPKVEVDIIVENPKSKDNTILNEYLTKGAVRYPDSALLGSGNTLIFGHSSNWTVVNNKAYKALNGIENLKRGDSIYVDSATSRYVYTVQSVVRVRADDQYVDFTTTAPTLTLATCDLFGDTKALRHVVEAVLDKKIALP